MKSIKETGIISTLEDTQGETRSKEDLESLLEALPVRLPIGIEHDMNQTTQGYIENFKLLPIEGQDGEWKLVGDLFLEKLPDTNDPLRGLSISFISVTERNSDDAAGCIYLPFPHYNREELNRAILDGDFPIAVGRWHKKAADPATVGLIINFTILALSPFVQHFYDRKVRPLIDEMLDRMSDPAFDGLAFDYVQPVDIGDGNDVKVILISDHDNWKESLQVENVNQGLDEALEFLTKTDIETLKPVSQLRMQFDSETKTYKPLMIQYADGIHRNLG